MTDFTQGWRLQRILVEAAQYRTLRSVYESDRTVGPRTAATLRECFRAHRDDAATLRQIAHPDDTV